jgi:hypothetical protein
MPLGSVNFEPEPDPKGERHIWLERKFVDRLPALRGPSESYSDVILRLAEEPACRHASRKPSDRLAGPGRYLEA